MPHLVSETPQSIPEQHAHLIAMMRGHYTYYGITGNFRRISWYARQVATICQKWLSRRDRRSRFPKSRFSATAPALYVHGTAVRRVDGIFIAQLNCPRTSTVLRLKT